ncbi:MAG: hypothetical protein LBJ76_03835, partial [Candidatus Accumulibacter sp.]|nr:hypothetical protein [Accumulibacter sp.]
MNKFRAWHPGNRALPPEVLTDSSKAVFYHDLDFQDNHACTDSSEMFQSTPVNGRNRMEEVTPLPSAIIPLKGEVFNRSW